MITVKYVLKIINPVEEFFHITNDVKNLSTLNVKINNSGLTIKGAHFKNGVYAKASSQLPVGESYDLNNNEELVIQALSSNKSLDVEDVLAINGKLSYEIDPKILSSMHILHWEDETLYRMSHVVEQRDDVVFFKIDNEGKFTLMAGAVFNGPSHLVHLHFPINSSQETYVYFVVGKTLRVGEGNDFHIPPSGVAKIPEGFCTIKNRLTSRSNVKFATTTNGAIIHSHTASNIKLSYPAEIDGVESLEYQMQPREYITLAVTPHLLSLDKLEDTSDNLTVVYKLDEDGSLIPELCLVSESAESLLESYNIVYNTNSPALLRANDEFKKAHVFVQYYLKVFIDGYEYRLENKDTLLNLLNNIDQFSNKIVKI